MQVLPAPFRASKLEHAANTASAAFCHCWWSSTSCFGRCKSIVFVGEEKRLQRSIGRSIDQSIDRTFCFEFGVAQSLLNISIYVFRGCTKFAQDMVAHVIL